LERNYPVTRNSLRLLCSPKAHLVFLCVLTAGCSHTPDKGTGATPPPAAAPAETEISVAPEAASTIRVERATLQPERIELRLPGKIQYDDDRYSRIASPVVGRIIEIKAKLGDRVAAGDPLLVIESPEIGTAYADYAKANSDLATARHALDLARDLFAGKALARKDLQEAENDANKAEAEFSRAQERLSNLHVPMDELNKPVDQQRIRSTFSLRSPISGAVVERNATLGLTVGNDPAQNLFTVADLSRVIAVADLSEKDLTHVAPGQTVRITTESYPDMTFTGRVAYISDLVDPNTRTVKLRCRVENSSRRLKPEMFARIDLTITQQGPPLPAVPLSALLHEGNQYVLFVRTGPNRFVRRIVSPRTISGSTAMIREGVQAGDEVVTDGALLLDNLSNNPA